jgi:hypothetical protein
MNVKTQIEIMISDLKRLKGNYELSVSDSGHLGELVSSEERKILVNDCKKVAEDFKVLTQLLEHKINNMEYV